MLVINDSSYLVVVHLVEVALVEVLGEALSEGHGQQLAEVLHGGVDRRGGDREKHEAQDL